MMQRKRTRGGERGQVLILVAMGLMLVMLAATALAVDIGNGLLHKRRLQSAADAATSAAAHGLSQGQSVTTAVTTAQSITSSNTGGAATLPYPGTGSGSSLSQGIEISSGDVRAALVENVQTYFAPIFGVQSLTVRARSRATVGPYGLLPITVKRFSEGNTAYPLGASGNPTQVLDNLAPAQDAYGQPNYITSWPSPLSAPASLPAAFTPVDAYDPRVSGPVVPIVGRRALANVANGSDFHFFVAPDVRGITKAVPDLYNGASVATASAAQLLKNTTCGYILTKGYPGPNPLVEEQLGGFSGAPTDDAVDAMRKAYRRGDVVAAMVYDGTVYRKPAFDLQIDAAVKTSGNIGPSGSPLTFSVTLVPRNNFSSSGVQFSASGLEGWADWQFEGHTINTAYTAVVPSTGVTVTFSVSATGSVEGARTAVIRADDTPSGTTRTVTATLVVGGDEAFSVSTAEAYKVVMQNSATRFDLDLRGWNGYPNTDVIVDAIEWYDQGIPPVATSGPSSVTVTHPSTVRVRDGQTTGLRINLDIALGATVGKWLIKVRVRDPNDSDRNQQIHVGLEIIPVSTNPTMSLTTSFVKVLGYAAWVITYANNSSTPDPSVDNNTVYAYAVSPLVTDPMMLGIGTRARLMGWNQTR